MSTNCVIDNNLSTLLNNKVDETLISEIKLLRGCILNIKDQIEQEGETSELLDELETREDELHFLYWQFGCPIKEELVEFRKQVGTMASMMNQFQEKHYKLQKARYVECKSKNHFTKKDREFIEKHKQCNEYYMNCREYLNDLRDFVATVIEVVNPDDIDHGWDEHWEAPENFDELVMSI